MTKSALPIVVGVDGSSSALIAVTWAAEACARHRVPLRLVHAYCLPTRGYPEVIISAQELRESMYEQGRLFLSQAVSVARAAAPDVAVEHDLRMEDPVPTLIAESARARQVVLGSHGLGGFTGALVGSTAVALAAHGECPVVVVRDGGSAGGPVVVGVDASPGSDAAIGYAFEEAATVGASVVAALAWKDFLVDRLFLRRQPDWQAAEDEQWVLLAQRMAGWQEKYPDVAVQQVVVRDRPVRTLLDMGASARLLVVGSRGHGGFTGMLLGSTSQALIYHAPCPIAVVRPR